MQYQGGKSRLAKPIAEVLLSHRADTDHYIEPFVGGGSVFAQMAPNFSRSVAADAMPDLIMLWEAIANGWIPPDSITEEQYAELRTAQPSALRGFAGFACSFAAKWFGGYARNQSGTNYAAQGSRSLLRRRDVFAVADIRHCDYRELTSEMGPGVFVYCDPPYADTLTYAGVESFDSAEFWKTAESWTRAGAKVFVSEYTAPPGWREVWSINRPTTTARHSAGARAVDRLFTFDLGTPAEAVTSIALAAAA